MLKRFEGQFYGFDQTDLFFQTWSSENVRGTLLLTHGMAEHSECYHPLAKTLTEDGWQVFAWDMRGHGRSEGKRGFVLDIDHFVADYGCFLKHVQQNMTTPQEKLVLFGHSLGGLITIRSVQKQNPTYGAMALSSPALGLSLPVPKFKETLAHLAVKWLPTITMYNEIKYHDLTRDEEMIRSYQRDNLRHDKISPGLFLTMVEGFTTALNEVDRIRQPVLMQLAGEDRLVSTQASRHFFEQLPNKKNQLVVYPESYHEVFNDLDRDEATVDLKKFIHPYLGGQ